jgi:outer membrane biosynthesis protein TonB
MKAASLCMWVALSAILCSGCSHKTSSPPQQAQAPPLQTGKGKLSEPKTTQPQEKSEAPLASPLPPPSAQSVPLPPPPPPKKVRQKHKVKTPPPAKPVETAQAPAAPSGGSPPETSSGSQPSAQPPATEQAAVAGTGSPIGQLTTGDSAVGERTRHETTDLIGETQRGLNGIKRSLSTEEKATAAQIRTFLKQAQQALEDGDSDGAHLLATRAKLLLDELTKP